MKTIEEKIAQGLETRRLKPLVNQFTKSLLPCSGCGNSQVEYFVEQKQKGEKVKFILQVEVYTESDDDDLFAVAQSDRSKWKVISGGPQRPLPVAQARAVAGNQLHGIMQTPTVTGKE